MDSIVEIDDVHFAFPAREIFSGISAAIPRGSIVGIMGASGSGKTTLLRLIGGQLLPQRGSIRIDGEAINTLDRNDLYRVRRKIGMQFQQGGLFTDLSVFENVAFPMREKTNLPGRMIRDVVLMKLNAVGLRGAAQLMPSELSGGMARRVGLARAIAMDPDLIIYDEPFSGLDPISCNVIGNLIRSLNDALGVTSIVVSYDAKEALKVIDHVYFIGSGKVVAQGPTESIRHSDDPLVRQFIRADPDGPIAFHLAGGSYARELGLQSTASIE
ncbi:MAG: ABC transporter ATP-binding protein [Burkholderiales bacterium]|nr:ABC transporter ATP-binding protein [Burkholderiales bacterium]